MTFSEDLGARQYISQYATDSVGLRVYKNGILADADTISDASADVWATMTTVDYDIDGPFGSQVFDRPAGWAMTGIYEVVLSSVETSTPGLFRLAWTYGLDGVDQTFSGILEVGKASPAYDSLDVGMKGVVESAWMRFCVDEETEALTKDGWKTVHQLCVGDQVMGLDHGTGLASWQPVQAVNVFPVVDEPMLSIESTVHSSLTTLNHKWPVLHSLRQQVRGAGRKTSKIIGAERGWRTSADLNSNDRLITAAPFADAPIEQKWSDAFVELVAWFWTEGSIITKPTGTILASVSQSEARNPQNVARIRQCLRSLFGDARKSDRFWAQPSTPSWNEGVQHDGQLGFYLNAAASFDLVRVAPDKVVLFAFLQELTQAQLVLFIESSIAGDGWVTKKGSRQLAQHDQARLQGFDLACILAGQTPRSRVQNGWYRGDPYSMWRTTIRHRTTFWIPRRGRETVPKTVSYSGIVWCPTTPTRTWMARRHGTVFFTGNSDLFDAPHGGPHLQVYFQSRFDRGRMAQLLRVAVQRLNTVAQPHSTYSIDDPSNPFPTAQWGGLLDHALYIEALKHLRRSYVEQPQAEGVTVARLDRRDYMQRWGELLRDEEADFKATLDTFKIANMGLGRPRVLVSGGVYGSFGPNRLPGSAAARPRYWAQWA